jgi:lysozyme family protein
MVAATYDAAMIRVFADEGGYTNDPVDPGGATNYGITIFDARKYWKPTATPADVKAMPKSVASDIYRKHYAAPIHYDELPAGFDYSVFDAAINSGIGRAPVWAAKSLGIGQVSMPAIVLAAKSAPDKVSLIQKYWAVRLSFLKGLSTFWRFGKGWTRRCTSGEAAAVRMWLSLGMNLSAADARKKMDIEAGKAKSAAKKAGTGAATSGAGPTIGGTSLDWSHMSIGGKVAVCAIAAVAVVAIVYFVRQSMIHNQRAAAYAAS